nr:AncY [synthetic construct]
MNLAEMRKQFEQNKKIYESAKLKFHGVEGFDVYNVSIPFEWNGKKYIFGRIERREEWARSWVRLFEETGQDEWTLVPDSMIYQLEDPFVSFVDGNLVMGGTHVRYKQNKVDTYYGYFYKGTDLHDLYYFTTGPEYMKDIRLVEMPDGRIGVFSRPRSEEIRRKYGSESMIGFTVINSLDELSAEVIENAPVIPNLFGKDEWGGCNQAYFLESGKIGVIGHIAYHATDEMGTEQQTYMNMSFVLDPTTHEASDLKIIGTRACYPDGPAKRPHLTDCAFSAGIVMRPDGKADLYSGIGDAEAGRITIDNPFEGYGRIDNKAIRLEHHHHHH